ncbi:uncharacterized protein [Physcomitrium patens]|uniref:uncharacterized protein n=1 Tax=Physcomitrium patens TaxID=3218 RepID=UPI003CCD3D6F
MGPYSHNSGGNATSQLLFLGPCPISASHRSMPPARPPARPPDLGPPSSRFIHALLCLRRGFASSSSLTVEWTRSISALGLDSQRRTISSSPCHPPSRPPSLRLDQSAAKPSSEHPAHPRASSVERWIDSWTEKPTTRWLIPPSSLTACDGSLFLTTIISERVEIQELCAKSGGEEFSGYCEGISIAN